MLLSTPQKNEIALIPHGSQALAVIYAGRSIKQLRQLLLAFLLTLIADVDRFATLYLSQVHWLVMLFAVWKDHLTSLTLVQPYSVRI
jgi:hypothetical protein